MRPILAYPEGIVIALGLLVFIGWSALCGWIGWSWGYVRGRRKGWNECRQFDAGQERKGEQL